MATNHQVNTQTRRNTVSFKDVQISYLMDGVRGVQRLVTDGQASKSTVRRALVDLKAGGRDVKELEAWVANHIGAPGRGRSAPVIGETRAYKAQQVKTGGPFLRLPLDVLGVEKGGVVRVRFDDDQIVVERSGS
jgi:hypothetical protein